MFVKEALHIHLTPILQSSVGQELPDCWISTIKTRVQNHAQSASKMFYNIQTNHESSEFCVRCIANGYKCIAFFNYYFLFTLMKPKSIQLKLVVWPACNDI